MKISPSLLSELADAINASGGLTPEATMRNRWDALWRSKFPVNKLYDAGITKQSRLCCATRNPDITA